ncbi:MAG: monovalent cation/H+ antiporter complex subunit F [Burkholderiales bacterium]|jgi:multicomponent K+:H+ antiporter subunit F
MIDWALSASLVLFVLAALLASARVLIGPSMADRLLALDALTTNALALVLLLALKLRLSVLFEVALIIALLGFVATVAGARLIGGQPLLPRR